MEGKNEAIEILKNLLGPRSEMFYYMSEGGFIFFLPKSVLGEEDFKEVDALAVKLGGGWRGWNDGFVVPEASLMKGVKRGVEEEGVGEEHPSDWRTKLLQDCSEIVGREWESVVELIGLKHALGSRVLAERERISHGEKVKFIKVLARDLHYSWRELYRCIEFAERFPDFEEFRETFVMRDKFDGQVSWRFIVHEVIPEKMTEAQKDMAEYECPICQARLTNKRYKRLKQKFEDLPIWR